MTPTTRRRLIEWSDWRSHLRRCTGAPLCDVVVLRLPRDDAERQAFFLPEQAHPGYREGARLHFGAISARVQYLSTSIADLATSLGLQTARAQAVAACRWAQAQGARLVVLGGPLGQLFGTDAEGLRRRFGQLRFSTGVHGPAYLAWADVSRALQASQLCPRHSRILLLGPYGYTGSYLCRRLTQAGYRVVACGSDAAALQIAAQRYDIGTYADIEQVGEVDAVISCQAGSRTQLTLSRLLELRRIARKLLVIDLSEPGSLDPSSQRLCRHELVVQQASGAHCEKLDFPLAQASEPVRHPHSGALAGDLAEGLALSYAIQVLARHELADLNWCALSETGLAQLTAAFSVSGITLAEPQWHGVPVAQFGLALPTEMPRLEELPLTPTLQWLGAPV